MKTQLIRSMFLGIAALALASCQAPSGPTSAVACPKCETVWVKAGGSAGKGQPVALRAAGAMNCPDCENKASPMLKGLSMNTHNCKTCGGTMFHCK